MAGTFVKAPWPRRLRSQEWFEGTSKDNIYHRSWMKNQGCRPTSSTAAR